MKKIITIVAGIITLTAVQAQHEHHAPMPDTPKAKTKDTSIKKESIELHGNHDMHIMDMQVPVKHMPHSFSLNLPMTRNGSGTSWLPDNSPMYAYMFHSKKWMYMLHGDVFIRYNKQDLGNKGSRGGQKFDAPNMFMFMGQRKVGKNGLFHFNTMFSLDPLTVGEEGYPLLFQTGESYKGQPLIDKQHPHDLISELSVSYAHALSKKADVFVYIGYPGEPAIGPAVFVHRPSGMFNPDAPLSHHWIDATHITFGVATVGFRYDRFKIEASSFTGREPNEKRYDLDKPLFNSWSSRLSFNPSKKWAWQVSHAFIKSPELLHPGEDVNRTTVSATYSAKGRANNFTNVTALWGMNKVKGHNGEHAALIEAMQTIHRLALYGRYEWVQKSTEELSLDESVYGHDELYPVNAFTLGLSYDIMGIGKTRVALGSQLSVYKADNRLNILYGDTPIAGQVYLRIYPGAMKM